MKENKYIGSAAFYKKTLMVVVPIMVQNGITNFVGMLDNIMVGQVGTEQMTGVAIVNQLIFVFNLFIFGGISGAGIYTAQFYGKGNQDGVKHTFRFKLMIATVVTAIAIIVFSIFGSNLIGLYLKGEAGTGDIASTLKYAQGYMFIMMFELFMFAITQVYAGTLRETGETVIPMKAGMVSVLVNLCLNYILIFGHFGMPALGVQGAAIATVVARVVELSVIVIWTHTHSARNKWIVGAYRSLRIHKELTINIIQKGTPLLLNEGMWAGGMAVLSQCYSTRGLDVIAGMNISNTLSNVFNIVFIAMGDAVAIIVGQKLGAGKFDEAKDTARKLIAFSVASCVGIGAIMAIFSGVFPLIYNTSDVIRDYATKFILVGAACMPMYAYLQAAYFTIRSGGKTIITFLFDSVYLWVVSIPVAYCLVGLTSLAIIPIYILVQSIDLIKCMVGHMMIKKGLWIQNIVKEE